MLCMTSVISTKVTAYKHMNEIITNISYDRPTSYKTQSTPKVETKLISQHAYFVTLFCEL